MEADTRMQRYAKIAGQGTRDKREGTHKTNDRQPTFQNDHGRLDWTDGIIAQILQDKSESYETYSLMVAGKT